MKKTVAAAAKVSVSESKIEWLRQRPYLCVSPHSKTDFRFYPTGFHISCCCNLDTKFSVNEGSMQLLEQVQQAMNSRQTHKACWRCYQEEAAGHVSERISYLMPYDMEQLQDFDRDGMWVPEVEIGTKFSNLCNLACRSCQSYDSSTWARLTKIPVDDPLYEDDLSDHDAYWQMLLDHIAAQSRDRDTFIVHPIGGETLLQQGFHRLVQWLIDSELSHRVTLRITTSLATRITDAICRQFEKFRKIELLASVDSVHENYAYVRWPAKFDRVIHNLALIEQLYHAHPDRFPVLGVIPIFSLNNIFYMSDVLDFWSDWTDGSGVPIHLSTRHLYRPEVLRIDVLPHRYRAELIDSLTQCLSHRFFHKFAQPSQSSTYQYISSVLQELADPCDPEEHNFQGYLKFSADYDRRTQQDSMTGNHRLFSLLNHQDREIYKQHFTTVDTAMPIFLQS